MLGNEWMATVRAATHLIGVVTAFCLIKYGGQLIEDGSVIGMIMIIMMIATIVFAISFCFLECRQLDVLEGKWKTFKHRMMFGSLRKHGAYKAARSLGEVTLRGSYPFCYVNNSTYMDLWGIEIDRLADMLLLFH